MKYVYTAQGSENFGAVLRVHAIDATYASYYYARCNTGFARITYVNGASFSNLTSSAFVLPQNTNVTITFSVVGSALAATFNAGGSPATVTLSATDTSITTAGLMGFRTTKATGNTANAYCSSIIAEEL